MGVYKTLDAVPHRHRLERYATRYDGRDTWAEFVDARAADYGSDHYRDTFRRAGRSWKEHMAEHGRHHALARPADVTAWCERLVESRTLDTAYKEYLLRVEQFYSWLQFHTEHPHVYQPVLMAARASDLTRRVWEQKFQNSYRGDGSD